MVSNTLILMRGWPGSGKSTKAVAVYSLLNANKITTSYPKSTDDYFLNEEGEYKWDPKKLAIAHKWNQLRVECDVLSNHYKVVIVDNTNILNGHMDPYIDIAFNNKWLVCQFVCKGEYKNKHNVSDEIVSKMKNNFEESELPHFHDLFINIPEINKCLQPY